jgi:DNA repair protein RadC
MNLKLLRVKEASGESISSPDAVARIMREEAKADRECFWILHLNVRNMIIEKELVSIGTANSSLVHPREVFKKAIVNGAKGIITVHNHPGGSTDPSYHDLEIWKKLKKSGEILGIEVMDNIILTPSGSYYSENTENCLIKKRKIVKSYG